MLILTKVRTIALGPNGTIKLAGPASFDASKCKSEKSLEDEELKSLIAKPLKASKIKKKKQTSGTVQEEGTKAI